MAVRATAAGAVEEGEEHTLEEDAPKDLSAQEHAQVEEHRNLRPLAVYEVIRREGVDELRRPLASLWWSGLAAGLSIGFSVVAEAALHAHLPDAPWRAIIESIGYSLGFLIVILGRYQLFTEITLTAVLPVLAEPTRSALAALARIWGVVFAANMVGTAIFAILLSTRLILPTEIDEAILSLSRELATLTPTDALVRGIVAGWLVATVAWLLPSAEHSRVIIIVALTGLISLLQLSHVVSGSVEIFYLAALGEIGIGRVLGGFILPLLVGNVIGGAALFALLAYGQVKDEMKEDGPTESPADAGAQGPVQAGERRAAKRPAKTAGTRAARPKP
ncbi:formate/nitrite transporter family protein [Roseixanthobacter glucoisosaccharinicivorans]|uniref:formate/nitrite transporter family protein n=1 Tax=Roseixanthobacter glucoisosaccharinicivorans TaxID=3119923 RepID=UPI003726A247